VLLVVIHLRRRWPVIFLALAPFLVLWPAVFAGQAIGPWDHIRSMAPWFGPKPQTPWDVLQADGVLQFAPWRSLVFDAWSHGQIPAWNNYQLMGAPLLANSQSAGFYPLHILVGVLHIPLYPAMTFLAWFHLFWAGLGVYLLVRRMHGTKTGAAIAGVSFSLSAFMVYWTALPSVITTVSWIPWAIACILAFFQNDVLWGIDENPIFRSVRENPTDALRAVMDQRRSQTRWLIGITMSVAMMILAGHLQFVAFGLLACLLVGAACFLKLLTINQGRSMMVIRRRLTAHGPETVNEKSITRGPVLFLPSLVPLTRYAFALLIAFCLAAPQLLPVLAFSKQSHRRSPPTSEGYAAYTASAIQPFEWSSLEFPKMIGDPSESMGDPQNHSLFWSALVKRGDAFGESALAIGPLVLLLLCFLKKSDWKRGLPIAIVGILGILIACGTPFDYLLYYLIPGWSSTGSPGRAIVLFVMAACCLAGLAIKPQECERNARGFLAFVLITAVINIGAVLGLDSVQSFIPGLNLVPIIHQAREIAAPMMLVAALLAILTAATWAFKDGKTRLLLLVAAAVCPALLILGVLRFGTPIDPATSPRSFDRFAYVNDHWNLFTTPDAQTPPNMATLLKIHDVAGYDSLLDKDTKAMLDAANQQDSSPPENGNMMLIKSSASKEALKELGVTEITGTQQNNTDIAGQRVSSTGGPATITNEDYHSISIKATGPGTLTLKDRNMPGWSAFVDGKPTPIKSGLFREIDLPAGQHVVEFRYWPPGLASGLVLFLLGLLSLASTAARLRVTRPRG